MKIHSSWVASAILAAIMALALFGFDSPIASAAEPQISSGNGIGDCFTSIKNARADFRRLDGTKSRRWEWKRLSSGALKHVKGPKVRGVVPDNHFIVSKWSSKWHLEGKLIVKKRFTLWCVPDSGTYSTQDPPIACPPTADDAVFMYGGKSGSWDSHIYGNTAYLYYNGGTTKLGGFTVPFQAFVIALKSWSSGGAYYYTPGDTVRPSYRFDMICWN